MWNKGFKRFFSKVMELLGGKLRFNYSGCYFEMEKTEELIVLKTSWNGWENIFTFNYDELYEVLVPKNDLKLLYYIQDLIEEIERGSHFLIVERMKRDLINEIAPPLFEYVQKLEEMEEIRFSTDVVFFGKEKIEQLKFVL